MNTKVCFALYTLIGIGVFSLPRAEASFDFMQIEQVIGGVNGDTTAQAIQLRMRTGLQNQVQLARVIAWDAAGQNPIIIIDMSTPVPNFTTGDRVLIASANFASQTSPAAQPDFLMTNLIPESYLAAGSLTFEEDPPYNTIYWRLSWGGANYTGSTTGSLTNDSDGDFGPPFADPLPSTCSSAVLFQGVASALSTQNLTDYALTAGSAVFTNNARANFTVVSSPPNCCTSVDCTGGIECVFDECVDGTCAGNPVLDDSICDNGQLCDGEETCDLLLGCQAGDPVDCGDGIDCTDD